MNKILCAFVLLSLVFSNSVEAQKKSKKKSKQTEEVASKAKPKNGIKPYAKVITKDAISDDGVFTIHQVDDNYFYEIPINHLEKDMLWVSRIAQIPNGLGGGFVNAGSKTNEQVVHWTRFQNKILLKICLLYTSPSPRDQRGSRMPSSA